MLRISIGYLENEHSSHFQTATTWLMNIALSWTAVDVSFVDDCSARIHSLPIFVLW